MRHFTLTLDTSAFIVQLDRGIGEPTFRQLGNNILTWLAEEGITIFPVNEECDTALGKYVYEVRGSQWKLAVATKLKDKLPVWFAEDEVELHIVGLKKACQYTPVAARKHDRGVTTLSVNITNRLV